MIQRCSYPGCGIVYGEKEPLADQRITHGLCPKHYELAWKELRADMDYSNAMTGILKVLIVEDNRIFREILKETVHHRFPTLELDEAVDGQEALQKTEILRPNLIFMDIKLPGENGLEVTKKIKARHPEIIVFVLSAYDYPEYREESLKYADYFFSKNSSTTNSILDLVNSVFHIQ
ncbi:MAG: response regulator [Deltaproteobacteria bacterium]|nr:response regulator [Deltaproteobacteria bacterium]